MKVKPAREGLRVLDPADSMKPLPVEGKEVGDFDSYWHRRILDGDVVKVEPKSTKEGK